MNQPLDLRDRHDSFMRQRHFGSLDGLRAISILAVIWHHTVGRDDSLPHLFSTGQNGVTLFFAISGFLIVTLLLREQQAHGRIDLRSFYVRRTLRIFPLYFAVLLLYVVLVLVLERNTQVGRQFFANLPYFASYTSNWFVPYDGRVIFYFSWSLAAEEQFYLVWPSVERFLGGQRSLLCMTALVAVILVAQLLGPPAAAAATPLWYEVIASVPLAICFGVVLAHALHGRRSYGLLRPLFGSVWSSLAWLLLALAALSLEAAKPLVHLALACLVGACVYREDHALAWVLRQRVVAYVGTISYGMYLLHMLVKNAVVRGLGRLGAGDQGLLVFVATVALTVLAATLSYRYFESYFLRLKTRFASARAAAPL